MVDEATGDEEEADDVLEGSVHKRKLGNKVKTETRVTLCASTAISSAIRLLSVPTSCLSYKKPLRRRMKIHKKQMN